MKKYNRFGKVFVRSKDWRRKISTSLKGNTNQEKCHSLKTRRKMSRSRLKRKEKLGYLHSIETRKKISKSHKNLNLSEETKKKIGLSHKGEKCYWWKGGICHNPYSNEWTQSLKKSIRKRDSYTCQICGKRSALNIHHIDYNKLNLNVNNLITLCNSCHSKTNSNRKYWKITLKLCKEKEKK